MHAHHITIHPVTTPYTNDESCPPIPIAVKRLSAASFLPGLVGGAASVRSASSTELRLLGGNGTLEIIVEARDCHSATLLRAQAASGRLRVLVGDESELATFDLSSSHANLVQFDVHIDEGRVDFTTSCVGLPPVFQLDSNRGTAISSPTRPDPMHGIALSALDLLGAADVLRWGHPIDDRTLASNLHLARVGTCFTLRNHELTKIRALPLVLSAAERSCDEIIEEQVGAFARVAGKLIHDDGVMSLSGGLDSRAAAAALFAAGKEIKCVTLAADERSLDLRLAAAFCAARGVRHEVVLTGEAFRSGLADRVLRSAEHTLGVSALAQSVDLYLYEQLGPSVTRRVSGNLGNQVGRGGVESLTATPHPDEILTPYIRSALATRPLEPWYVDRMRSTGFAQTLFTQEVNYWSIANYVLGSSFAVQQSPYADRALIRLASELFRHFPDLRAPTVRDIRRRDLRHRLAGPPVATSFQRQFLGRFDTPGTAIGINWGWLARGGWSPRWLVAAAPTVASAILSKVPAVPQWCRTALPSFGLADWPRLVRSSLRDLTFDTLSSKAVRDSGAFEPDAMGRLLHRHFSGAESHHATVARSLEIGLACRLLG
jgi:hypothetical protein